MTDEDVDDEDVDVVESCLPPLSWFEDMQGIIIPSAEFAQQLMVNQTQTIKNERVLQL